MKKVFVLMASLLFSYSCTNEKVGIASEVAYEEEILVPATARVLDGNSLRATAANFESEEFAKLLASSLKDSKFRKFLKDEANKQFDGDFDILVSKVIKNKVDTDDFETKMKKNNPNGLAKGKEVIDNAMKNPLLNISIPLLIEKWDDTKQFPLVAVAVGVSEKDATMLKAFDKNGKIYLIDAKKEPNLPVIVIGNNERTNYQKSEINNNSKKQRVSGNQERINWIKCKDLNSMEGWFLGGPEIQFDAVVYNNDFSAAFNASSSKRSCVSRGTAQSGWIPENSSLALFEWHFDQNHGPDYYLQVGEMDDSGTTFKFTVGVTAGKKDVISGTGSLEITYKKQDIRLPSELIHYTSVSPRTISDYRIEYTVINE